MLINNEQLTSSFLLNSHRTTTLGSLRPSSTKFSTYRYKWRHLRMGASACHATYGRLCGNASTALDVPISVTNVSGFATVHCHTTVLNTGLARSSSPLGCARQ